LPKSVQKGGGEEKCHTVEVSERKNTLFLWEIPPKNELFSRVEGGF